MKHNYKRIDKKQKTCPCCGQKFYGYKNQKFCIPYHGTIFWKYGNIQNTPKALKRQEEAWNKRVEMSKSGIKTGERWSITKNQINEPTTMN